MYAEPHFIEDFIKTVSFKKETGSPFELTLDSLGPKNSEHQELAEQLIDFHSLPRDIEKKSSRAPLFEQLELRAIFRCEGALSKKEILQYAGSLARIHRVEVVSPEEMVSIRAMDAVMESLGCQKSSWKVTSSDGVLDFVSNEGTTLAVLYDGEYGAGAWEALMVAAREIGRLESQPAAFSKVDKMARF